MLCSQLFQPDDLNKAGERWGDLETDNLDVDIIEFPKKPKSWKSKLPQSDVRLNICSLFQNFFAINWTLRYCLLPKTCLNDSIELDIAEF